MIDTQTLATQFKKPEKIGAIALMVAVGAVIAYAFFRALPTLIELAQETIYFGMEVVIGIVLVMIFLNRQTWITIQYAIANQLRKIRRMVVHLDPIGVLNTAITQFTNKLGEIDEALVASDAARKRQVTAMQTAQKKADNEKAMADQAKRENLPDVQITQHFAACDRWMKAVDGMRPQAELLDKMQTALEQARDLCAAKLEDFKNQKSVKAMELDIAQSNKVVVNRFKKFFGSSPELEMQDMALEEIERQTSEAEAEVDQLMRFVNPMLADADLKKQAETQQAMARFNQFTAKALPAGGVIEGATVTTGNDKAKK